MPPPLIPSPTELQPRAQSEAFKFDWDTPIQLGPGASAETLFAARQLQNAVAEATGLIPPIRKGHASSNGITLDPHSADHGAEGYAIEISPQTMLLSASTEAGVFYAVQT